MKRIMLLPKLPQGHDPSAAKREKLKSEDGAWAEANQPAIIGIRYLVSVH